MPCVSVIVPALVRSTQQIVMTINCIKMAREKTKIPFELIVVETLTDYFDDLADVHIYEKEKTTTTISINRGLRASNKNWKVLLTNDVFVKDDWLECLIDCFKIEDCGASTLASSQFNHQKENKIEEGNWWSVVMMPQHMFNVVGYFDESYPGVFDDTDLLLKIYLAGYKMYRNFNCVVNHTPGSTVYAEEGHREAYRAGRKLFNERYKNCKLPIFEKLK